MTEQPTNLRLIEGRGSPAPLTAELDLWNPPARLNDAQLATVETIARSPLPALPSCAESHLAKCLRIMLAVLPRQQADELAGELFVEAYKRQLGAYPNEAISYLADRATATCRWFPTIAECLEILSGWHRNDEAIRRRNQARDIARREHNQRWIDDCPPTPELPPLTQADVDAMNETMVSLGIGCGAIIRDANGNPVPAPDHPA